MRPPFRQRNLRKQLRQAWRTRQMKITEQSKDHLVVRHVPWFIGGIMAVLGAASLYASIFKPDSFTSTAEAILVPTLGVAMLGGAWWFAPIVTLVFERTGARVTFRESRLLRPSEKIFDLRRVERVQLQANWSDGSRLTRLALRTEDGVTPLETGYTSADRKEIMKAINAWLAGETPDMENRPQEPTVRR